MGVPGLWDVVHPAGRTRSMTQVATEAFVENRGGKRGYRIGIDASIWYHHASFSKKGESPELRFLFFKLCRLTRLPLIPLFVFDGCERPKVKRGSRMGKAGSHALTAGFKKLLELFGMEWRMALGEAEAELAWLNRQGVIDAIISDDVDAIVFGAVNTMKNSGLLLSGNKSKPALDSNGKRSASHVWSYNADDIQRNPNVDLSRAGLVLIALLSGGDYSGGVSKIGPTVAHGLARCGFGEDLMRIYEQRGIQDIKPLLSVWRDRANQELQTNASGFLSRRSNTLVPIDFPDFKIMENYVNPVTTERQRRPGGGTIRDSKVMSLPRLAAFCERHFGDWGYEDEIVKRFRTLLWESVLIFLLRHAAIEADERQKRRGVVVTPYEVGTPLSFIRRHLESSKTDANDRIAAAFVNQGSQPDPLANEVDEDKNPLRMQIVASRQHVSTDHTLEYRVEFTPSIFVEMTRKACKLKAPTCPNNHTPAVEDEWNVMFDGPAQTKKKDPKTPGPAPDSAVRMWVPGVIMETVHPSLVEAAKKSGTWKGKGRAPTQPMDHLDDDSEEEDDTTLLGDTPRSNDSHGGKDFRAQIISPSVTPVAASDRVVPPHTFVDPRPNQVGSSASTLNVAAHSGQAVLGQSDPARPPSGLSIWFPNPDDPDMLVLEDGLELPPVAQPPPRPTASTGPSRERVQSLEGQPRDIWDDAYNKTMPIALGSSQSRRAGPPKKTPTRKTTSSSQSQRVVQPEQRAPQPAPDFAALFADEDPVQSSGRHASDDASNQVFAPRSQRLTAPAPKRNPPSPPRPQSQRVDPPRRPQRHAEPVPPSEDDDSDGPQNIMDIIFQQTCFPGSKKAKRGPVKRPATGSPMTRRDTLNKPAKRPRTQESGPVAGTSTARRPRPPQPVHRAPPAMDDADVIEIESDDDETVPKPTQRASGPANIQPRHARRFPETGPSSDDDVIDLT